MKRKLLLVGMLCLCFIFPLNKPVFASSYSTIVAYGDSLTDDGNIGRFTDGSIWVESLAGWIGATLVDNAYGGATTGLDNPAAGYSTTLPTPTSDIFGLQWQVGAFAPGGQSDTLYTVWAGANDFSQNRNAADAATNIRIALESLYLAGARDFLVPNLPDLGMTPLIFSSPTPLPAYASAWTAGFNLELAIVLLAFDTSHSDINLFDLDVFSIFNEYAVGTSEWEELFWNDGFHPSSIGHSRIFKEAAAAIGEPVPEPATLILFAFGILSLAGTSRKKVNKLL